MEFISVQDLIKKDGLRIVLVKGAPSPWGQAAKAMIEYKGLNYAAAPQLIGDLNVDIVAWAGVNSAPVVAWNDNPPLNRWNDILFLLERLAPHKPLVPDDAGARVHMLGLAHEICGELGLGWNRRLSMFQPAMQSGQAPAPLLLMSRKYGYNESDVAQAKSRQVAMLNLLADQLEAQKRRGSDYLIGDKVSAVDFYWAAFSNLFAPLPPAQCPMAEAMRPMFESVDAEVKAALAPILIAHRDRIMRAHFKLPMEF